MTSVHWRKPHSWVLLHLVCRERNVENWQGRTKQSESNLEGFSWLIHITLHNRHLEGWGLTHTDLVIGLASPGFINIWKDSFEEEFLCSLNCLFLLYWVGRSFHSLFISSFIWDEQSTAVRILKSDQLLSSSQHRLFCKIELEKISDIWRFLHFIR